MVGEHVHRNETILILRAIGRFKCIQKKKNTNHQQQNPWWWSALEINIPEKIGDIKYLMIVKDIIHLYYVIMKYILFQQ